MSAPVSNKDLYAVLHLRRGADQEVVDKAYRALSMKYHPDRAPEADRESATARMQRINAAYAVLGDPLRRAAYDRSLAAERPSDSGWNRFLESGLVGLFLDRNIR